MNAPANRSIARRSFLSRTAAGLMGALYGPTLLGADDKSGNKLPVVGSGEHTYEVIHDWGRLPSSNSYGNTHGVRTDSNRHVFVHHTVHQNSVSRDAMVVFDAKGEFVRSWGPDYAGGAHGLHIRREGGGEALYLCDTERNLVVKTDLNGKEIFRLGFPNESPVYSTPRKNGRPQRYKPTNVAVASNGDIYVGDGYGSSYINRYDKSGKFLQTIGSGRTDAPGGIKSPHGLIIDSRGGTEELLVADRTNRRLQYFSLDGKPLRFVENVALPCHFDIFKNGDLLVPDLAARVTLLDRSNKLITHLGEGGQDWVQLRTKARESFRPGQFVCPHSACFDPEGNIFVVEWVEVGRVTKLRKVA